MTCVIGLVHDGQVYMGCDSAAVNSWDIQATRLRKVFCVGPFLIGYTTSFRMGQLLQNCLEVPVQEQESDDAYMTRVFIASVRKCLKEGGFTKVENNQEEGGEFLVGYHGALYMVCGDFQVNSFLDDFSAVGGGAQYAMGAMASTPRMKPESRIRNALEVSARFSIGVRGPFHIEASTGR